jgi:hypothetical protein
VAEKEAATGGGADVTCNCSHPDRPARPSFYCRLAPPPAKRAYVCSLCLKTGHYRTRCPGPDVEPMGDAETLAIAEAAGL